MGHVAGLHPFPEATIVPKQNKEWQVQVLLETHGGAKFLRRGSPIIGILVF